MKKIKKNELYPLKDFLILWSTQSVSQLGSSITAFALTLWLYEKTGSSLSTAALTICSYAPYVLISIFAGALTDRFDKKKTMLVCDVLAVLCTIVVFGLFNTNRLMVWHLYALNAISGLMNTVQQPASEVAMTLLLFMAGVNLVASAFDATLPGYVLPNPKGSQAVLGIVTSCSGIAMIIGSLVVSALPKPKDRVKVVYLTMLFSMGTENFIMAFSREPLLWCIGQVVGWILVPVMSTNLEVILRSSIPVELQGRVYACRNTLQFFTIPIGLFLGGFMVDNICEPFMIEYGDLSILKSFFGTGKGSGAALMMFILGVSGSLVCLIIGRKLKRYQYKEM